MQLLSAAAALALMVAGGASGTELVAEKSWRHDAWAVHLYRTPEKESFCALESLSDGARFRIVQIKATGETLLEVFNPAWALAEGQARFTLDFSLEKDTNYLAKLDGASWEGGYVYVFKDEYRYRTVSKVLAEAASMVVRNADGAHIAGFSGSGSRAALASYEACVGNN